MSHPDSWLHAIIQMNFPASISSWLICQPVIMSAVPHPWKYSLKPSPLNQTQLNLILRSKIIKKYAKSYRAELLCSRSTYLKDTWGTAQHFVPVVMGSTSTTRFDWFYILQMRPGSKFKVLLPFIYICIRYIGEVVSTAINTLGLVFSFLYFLFSISLHMLNQGQ